MKTFSLRYVLAVIVVAGFIISAGSVFAFIFSNNEPNLQTPEIPVGAVSMPYEISPDEWNTFDETYASIGQAILDDCDNEKRCIIQNGQKKIWYSGAKNTAEIMQKLKVWKKDKDDGKEIKYKK